MRTKAPKIVGLPAVLRTYRHEHRLSQAEAARNVGVSEMTWWKWENGRGLPRRIVNYEALVEELRQAGIRFVEVPG